MMDIHFLRQAKDPANLVPETETIPVLEAGDLASLLEQFEATEQENMLTNNISTFSNDVMTKEYSVKWEQASGLTNKEENNHISNVTSELSLINKIHKPCLKNPTTNTLLDYLPQEVVDRIRVSGKRKPITVIEPLVYLKKTKTTKTDLKELEKIKNNVTSNSIAEMIMLEHNYCSTITFILNKKDSGFVSSEEEDRIMSGQINLKNIVKQEIQQEFGDSLSDQTKKKKLNLEEYKKRRKFNVKSENISPNESTCSSPLPTDECEKMLKHQEKLKKMAQEVLHATPKTEQKLNIKIEISPTESICNSPLLSDEYEKMLRHQEKLKKMAEEVLHATPKSEQKLMNVKVEKISPNVSMCNSPLAVEDYEKMMGHQEKLKKMAEEVLHATPKYEQNSNVKIKKIFPIGDICSSPLPVNKHERHQEKLKRMAEEVMQQAPPISEPNSKVKNKTSDYVRLPENLERKVIVSFGCNTDWSQNKQLDIDVSPVVQNAEIEHGENKEVLHLPKDRIRCQTREVATQTDISLINQFRRKRRLSSSSSCSTCSEASVTSRNRLSSESSTTSTSSDSSDSSSSSWQTVATLPSPPRSPNPYCRESYKVQKARPLSPRINRKRSLSPRISSKRLTEDREHRNAVEERRIIYVGRIKHSTTKEDLQKKFQKFGPITKISLHFRDQGENYGFVTFRYKQDAHEAYERGNNDPAYANFKISFGGRREFCQNPYADLDNMQEDKFHNSQSGGDSFDNLLKEMQEKLKSRK